MSDLSGDSAKLRPKLLNLFNSFNFVVILVITSLHLAFIVIFDKVTAFAPDEANYIGVFNNLYKSDFSLEGYLGWQEGSINALRVIYLPAKLLEVIGFSDFYSVRFLSVFYSTLSLYLLLKLAPERRILSFPVKFWIASAYFIPSVFVWSSLGLRESFIFFSYTAIFFLLLNPQGLSFRIRFLLLIATSTFFLISKIYLFGLFLFSLAFSLTLLSFSKKKTEGSTLALLSSLLLPLLMFPSIAENIVVGAKTTFEAKQISSTSTPTSVGTGIGTGTGAGTVPVRGQTLHFLNEQFDRNPILSWFSTATGIRSFFNEKAESAFLPAGSKELYENTALLQTQRASLQDPKSLALGAYNFLFVPTPFVDNGSFFLNIQSFESFIWYFYYLILILLLIGLIRGKYYLNFATILSCLFTLGFIVLSALIEVNDGTSVRHRAVLIMGILVMLATFERKQSDHLEHQSSRF
jgi:hypothetical protein